MAERYRTAAGNWSDATKWNGGTTLPGVSDACYANGFACAIDQSITVASLNTKAGTTAAAGGGFTCVIDCTINAAMNAGTSACLTITAGAQTINGHATGGSGSNIVGLVVTSAFPTITGNAYAGTGINAYGGNIQNGTWIGDSHSGNNRPALLLSNGATQIGISYADAAGSFATLAQQGGVHIGDAFGGGVSAAYGTQVSNGGIFYGRAAGGSASSSYGVYALSGGLAVVTAVTDNVAKGCNVGNDGLVICQGSVLESQIGITAIGGRYRITRGVSPFRPFIRPPIFPAFAS